MKLDITKKIEFSNVILSLKTSQMEFILKKKTRLEKINTHFFQDWLTN